MKIETIEVAGFRPAISIAMRNPMDSWAKSDTVYALGTFRTMDDDGLHIYTDVTEDMHVGDADKDLSIRLQTAGPEHCKHLRMIMVWANIEAPRYWWTEMATYRYGVETVSCSTMHKLMARPLTSDDFEVDDKDSPGFQIFLEYMIDLMNEYRDTENPEDKKAIWRHIIQMLPQSYIQKRTVMMSYAALRNIYRQRKGHRLKEWDTFRKWVRSLPESWMITDEVNV